jgi:hypothetical protein
VEVRGTSSTFQRPESRRAAGNLLNSFHVMMWFWWCAWPGLGGSGSPGRRRGRAAAGARAHRRSGPVVLVQESEIGRVGELRWVMEMLFVHWIGDGKQRGRLTTVARGCGGGPVRCGGRESKWQWECGCGNVRGSALGALGCASS